MKNSINLDSFRNNRNMIKIYRILKIIMMGAKNKKREEKENNKIVEIWILMIFEFLFNFSI